MASATSSRAAPGPSVPFVGRLEEARWLRELRDQAAAGEARVALIEGESGVGKSRMLREFLREADDAGWQTLWGRYSNEAAPAHAPFVATLADQARRGGLLNEREHAALETSEPEPLRRAEAFARLAEKLGGRRPLMLVLDDLHLAEASAAGLFCEFARCLADAARTRPMRVLVIAALHPQLPGDALGELLARLRREAVTASLELHGLGEPEVSELLRHSFRGRCQPPLIDAVHRASQGNPLFVLQLAGTLLDGHLLVEEAGGFRTRTPAGELVLPVTAPDAIRTRIEALAPDVLSVVQTASLLGDEFELEDLEACSAVAPGAAIDAAVALGLVEERGRDFAFHHHLVRHAFVQSLGPVERRQAHRRIAEALHQRFGDDPDHRVAIALHLLDADGARRAPLELGPIYERAGDAAMAVFARATALRLYEAAIGTAPFVATLTPPQLGWLQVRTARVNDNTGNRPRARELYYQAIQNLRGSTDYEAWGLAVLSWERTYTNASERIPTDAYEVEFAEACGEAGRDLRVRLLTQRADAMWITRDPDDMPTAQRAAALAEQSEDPAVRAEALVTLGLVQMRHLEPEAALRSFDASRREGEQIENPIYRGWGWTRRAWPLVLLGEVREGQQAAETSGEYVRRNAHWHGAALAGALRYSCEVLLGDAPNVSGHIEPLLMISRSSYLQPAFMLDSAVAWQRLLQGEFEEAQDARASWERTAGRRAATPLRYLIDLAAGQREAVVAALSERPWSSPSSEPVDFMGIGSLCISGCLAGELDSEEIAETVYRLLAPLPGRGIVFSLAPPMLIERTLGICARVLGRYSLAHQHLDDACKAATRAGTWTELGLISLEQQRLRSVAGLAFAAPTDLDSALNHFRRCGLAWLTELAHGLAVPVGPSGKASSVPDDELSPIEREVLGCWATGLSEPQIAAKLLLSEVTVQSQLRRATARLGLSSPAEAARFASAPAEAAPLTELTPREREVLSLIAQGRTNAQIAEALVISQHTAIRHVANILEKTGSANRTEAARLAVNSSRNPEENR